MRPTWELRVTALYVRIALAGLALLVGAAVVSAQDAPKPSKAMFEKACSACHSAESASASRRTREQWQEVIDEMVTQQGAKVADDEVGPILEYLVTAFGKVNVNTAKPEEIAQITGLSQKDAEAVVRFRKDKGKIEDFDALSKVPGIDTKILESHREAIAY